MTPVSIEPGPVQKLRRELNVALHELDAARDRITQLEQAGDEVARAANGIGTTATDDGSFIVRSLRAVAAWTKLRNP